LGLTNKYQTKLMRNEFVVFSIVSIIVVGLLGYYVNTNWYGLFIVLLPIIGLGIYEMSQKRHAIMRNFPVLGRMRYIMEWLRPKIYQYFVESDTDGTPYNRMDRSIVYQRAKNEIDTVPFGTQLDVYAEGYEFMNHSIAALDKKKLNHHPRVTIGGSHCKQPYEASILNVSAMSFGSLSKNAVMALNGGAKIGHFAHNTGEGGVSPYHLSPGGDLIYQVGTGYFGCRAADGGFDEIAFRDTVSSPTIKMIELKLSQGAKPGHGGILPAKKNTPEIAKIRKIQPGIDVDSPPFHRAFSTPKELLQLLQTMRELSDGRPVGFKLCVGNKHEFVAICKAMVATKITPDFITVDGGEGGTGAAPVEFSNHVGMPFREALAFAHNTLIGFGLRSEIKLIASGHIVSGFDMFRAFALGADACNCARAMMIALGCIQALECNKNSCPTGVATQDEELVQGLFVDDKKVRVANFHKKTVESFVELMAGAGIDSPTKINRRSISRRVFMNQVKRYDQIYPYVAVGALLTTDIPNEYEDLVAGASADSFAFMEN
jgi:glutamate synthase domain-containing protein 2